MAKPSSRPDGEYFESFDYEDFWLDKPGDTTIRPCRPEHLEFLKALRARVQAAEAAAAQKRAQDAQQS